MHYVAHYDEAEHLLQGFVTGAGALHGELYVHNVHSLVHLSQDTCSYGLLDSFSAFLYESYLGQLKMLQQILKRTSVLC